MRTVFFVRNTKLSNEEKEEKQNKKSFRVLLYVFMISLVTVALLSNVFIDKNKKQNLYYRDYVSVFNESDLYEILFYSYESNNENESN